MNANKLNPGDQLYDAANNTIYVYEPDTSKRVMPEYSLAIFISVTVSLFLYWAGEIAIILAFANIAAMVWLTFFTRRDRTKHVWPLACVVIVSLLTALMGYASMNARESAIGFVENCREVPPSEWVACEKAISHGESYIPESNR